MVAGLYINTTNVITVQCVTSNTEKKTKLPS